jgi:translocation protein SEC72
MKDEGNNLYKLNKTREALSKYNMAASIAVQRPAWESAAILREELSTVVSNRSAALLELGDYLGALVDAETVISIRRQWPKGHFRKAKALVALGHIEEAKDAISLGLQFEPNNTELSGYMLELDKQLASRNQPNTKEKSVSVTSS